jgi:hypothetical protein
MQGGLGAVEPNPLHCIASRLGPPPNPPDHQPDGLQLVRWVATAWCVEVVEGSRIHADALGEF